jgi:hypothetical protein
MKLPERLPCPCGSELSPVAWKKRSVSNLFRLRCPRCGLQPTVSSARHEAAVERWNEAVVLKRDLKRRGAP